MIRVLNAFRFNEPQVMGVAICAAPGIFLAEHSWWAPLVYVAAWACVPLLVNLIAGPPA
jgi:hypothetical protein